MRSPQLQVLGKYLAGEFDNQEQAIADPARYVHLKLWHRPISLFAEDSVTLFAEQVSIVNINQPYRQRIIRVLQGRDSQESLFVQYYMPKSPSSLYGAGRSPALLDNLTAEQLELLPGCTLNVHWQQLGSSSYQFTAIPPPDACCTFTYLENTVQVVLGFEITEGQLKSHDKGIDPLTGKVSWGAIWGHYCYKKREQY
jgi:hypothetical protein